MPIETSAKKTKVWGGVLFLFGYNAFITAILHGLMEKDNSNYTVLDSFSQGIGVATFLAILIYVVSAKKYHFNPSRKTQMLAVLFILVNLLAFYLGRYYYRTSPAMSIMSSLESNIKTINPKQKMAEVNDINNKISSLSQAIQEVPENKRQAIDQLVVIDQLIELYKRGFTLSHNMQDEILKLNAKADTPQTQSDIRTILKNMSGLDVNVLPAFQQQHTIWFEAVTANLLARKEYYQSYVNGESAQTQEYLLKKWDNLASIYGQEEAKLLELQAQMKSTK